MYSNIIKYGIIYFSKLIPKEKPLCQQIYILSKALLELNNKRFDKSFKNKLK